MKPDFDDAHERGFYERDVTDVAHDLLGCYLVRRERGRIRGGRIVEVEAYGGPGDPGSHADRAPNGRARIMFGPAGIAYVYFTYGMHHCVNAVAGEEGVASAVLIRALEPVWDVERMRRDAPTNLPDVQIASGPGRLCRALGVDRDLNGSDLARGPLRVLRRTEHPGPIASGERVGLSVDDGRPWRFHVASPAISRFSRGSRRPGSRR
jgi:DNA-3-methyladenine glycosylase